MSIVDAALAFVGIGARFSADTHARTDSMPVNLFPKAAAERRRLRKAIENHAAKSQQLAQAQGALRRAQDLINAVGPAEAAAKAAQERAAAFTQQWVERGARPDESQDDAGLLHASEQAARALAACRTRAAGAELALPALEERIKEAHSAVIEPSCPVHSVDLAVSEVLAALALPSLEHLERVHREYLAARAAVVPLVLTQHHWGSGHHLHCAIETSASMKAIVERADAVLNIAPLPDPQALLYEIGDSVQRWADLAKRLAANASAQFEDVAQ